MPDANRLPFVILTYPRSGSTWLVSLLNQVEGITAYGEMFLQRKRAPGEPRWDADFTHTRFIETNHVYRVRPMRVFAYLDDLYDQDGAVGFKLMSAHLRGFPELLAYFRMRRVRVIHLVRTNTLDQIISQALTVQLAQSHRLAGQTIQDNVQVTLNTATLVKNLRDKQRTIRRMETLLRLTRLPVHRVSYEELQRGAAAFRAVCAYLSVPHLAQVPDSRFIKIRRESHLDILKNYHEVIQALQGTPFFDLVEK